VVGAQSWVYGGEDLEGETTGDLKNEREQRETRSLKKKKKGGNLFTTGQI